MTVLATTGIFTTATITNNVDQLLSFSRTGGSTAGDTVGRIAFKVGTAEEGAFIVATNEDGSPNSTSLAFGTKSGAGAAVERLRINPAGAVSLSDGVNINIGTSTGTKIGTTNTQKIGFFNTTPVVQPAAVANATDAASVIARLNDLLARLRTIGIIDT